MCIFLTHGNFFSHFERRFQAFARPPAHKHLKMSLAATQPN